MDEERFGLPLSLVEALRVDPSPTATLLADLLTDDVAPVQAAPVSARMPTWRSMAAGLALTVGLGAQAYAATPSLEGRWTMAPSASNFREEVTGPAPDAVTVEVTRDDGERLVYQVVESRRGVEVARADYDLSFDGAPSTSHAGGAALQVSAARDARGDVVVQAPPVGAMRATIRVLRTGADTSLLEHDIEGAGGARAIETISLVRIAPPATDPR